MSDIMDVKIQIAELIKDQDPELDEPKVWKVEEVWIEDTISTKLKGRRVIMTERQKRILEKTYGLNTLKTYNLECITDIKEIPEKEITDEEKERLGDLKREIELIKNSTDPKLNKKGIYSDKCSNKKYTNYFYEEFVEVEATLRQAWLATIPETRWCFKPYTPIEKFSKITLKSIKEAINNHLKRGER